MTNRHAPKDLYELRLYNKGRRQSAEEAKVSLIMAQIREAKIAKYPLDLKFLSEDYSGGADDSRFECLSARPYLSDFRPRKPVDFEADTVSVEPPAEPRADQALLGFPIPDFPTRLK